MDKTANDGGTILHGGAQGLQHHAWDVITNNADNSVSFTHTSAYLSMGFPGTVKFEIVYRLVGNRLRIELSGAPDCPTPISPAQHNYFNLGHTETILEKTIIDHKLFIVASHYTPVDTNLIPTGEILPVAHGAFDFRIHRDMRGCVLRIKCFLTPLTTRNSLQLFVRLTIPILIGVRLRSGNMNK